MQELAQAAVVLHPDEGFLHLLAPPLRRQTAVATGAFMTVPLPA